MRGPWNATPASQPIDGIGFRLTRALEYHVQSAEKIKTCKLLILRRRDSHNIP